MYTHGLNIIISDNKFGVKGNLSSVRFRSTTADLGVLYYRKWRFPMLLFKN